jgi:hypothetical protein
LFSFFSFSGNTKPCGWAWLAARRLELLGRHSLTAVATAAAASASGGGGAYSVLVLDVARARDGLLTYLASVSLYYLVWRGRHAGTIGPRVFFDNSGSRTRTRGACALVWPWDDSEVPGRYWLCLKLSSQMLWIL